VLKVLFVLARLLRPGKRRALPGSYWLAKEKPSGPFESY
jgi:hypothetical protein